MILWSGTKLLWTSAQELMDAQADEPFVREIRKAAFAVPGVSKVDKLWVRKSGLEYLVDIHIQVPASNRGRGPPHRPPGQGQAARRFTNVRDVLVHLEPYPHLYERGEQHSDEDLTRWKT